MRGVQNVWIERARRNGRENVLTREVHEKGKKCLDENGSDKCLDA